MMLSVPAISSRNPANATRPAPRIRLPSVDDSQPLTRKGPRSSQGERGAVAARGCVERLLEARREVANAIAKENPEQRQRQQHRLRLQTELQAGEPEEE